MHTFTSNDGTRIAYDRTGSGPALILVDGALTSRNDGSKPALAGLLAPHFTVYTYDRRGRGDSGDTPPYAVEREIEDIAALIDIAGGTAALAGHSSGATLAMLAAAELGPNVTGVALYEPPHNDDPAAQEAWRTYTGELAALLAAGRSGDAVARFMALTGATEEGIAEVRQLPFFAHLEAIAPTLAYDHIAILGETAAVPLDVARRVSVPALVMSGSASFPFMAVTARTLSQAFPNGTYQSLDGESHEVAPEALSQALIVFFAPAPATARTA